MKLISPSFLVRTLRQVPAALTLPDEVAFRDGLSTLEVRSGPAWPNRFGEALRHHFEDVEPVRTLSLFAGGGGLDLGFHDAGFEILEAVEVEPRYAATLERNSGERGLLGEAKVRCVDVREYSPEKGLDVDFVIGGPPCQTFSAAGRRASGVRGTADDRGTLFEEYVRLLEELQPTAFLFENVYGITGAQGGEPWAEIMAAFERIGYSLSWRVLDAADYGVPQHRERLFIVGWRDGSFAFPRPTHGPDSPDGAPFYASGEAVVGAGGGAPPGVNGRYGHLLDEIPPGLNYSFFTAEMGHPRPVFAWRSKFSDFLYKADPERPTRTIKAQGGQYTGPFHWDSRPFSVAELKRLQTFPSRYTICGGRQAAIEQIGNSVPPQLARILALAVRSQVFASPSPIDLDLLAPEERLGFRQRKRALTKRYRQVASAAISRDDLAPKPPAERGTRQRVLGGDFLWAPPGTGERPEFDVRTSRRGSRLDVIVMAHGEEGSEPALVIEAKAPAGSEWSEGFRAARLLSTDRTPRGVLALWKAFEEVVRERWHFADLVQLSGYYQYEPRLEARLVQAPEESDLWTALTEVTAGSMVGTTAPAGDFLSAWGMTDRRGQLVKLLRQLRGLGYEPRNRATNPQIKRGSYLVPYAFPTLTPQSVQLRKRL